MNNDLHDIDDLFRSAIEDYEEMPSARVKQNLVAALDKKNVIKDKRKVSGWKKTSLFLLCLVAGFNLYDTSNFNKSLPQPKEQNAGIEPNDRLVEDDTFTKQINKIKDRITAQDSYAYEKNDLLEKPDETNDNTSGEHNDIFDEKKHGEIFISSLMQKKVSNSKQYVAMNIPCLPSETLNNIRELKTITHSIVHPQSIQNIPTPKDKYFKPFWLMTAFASYESAGYRLDSDIPNNITSIKHSEVQEPSFSLGVLTTRQLKQHWGMQTGLIYSQTDIGITPQKLFALQNPTGDIAFKYITSSGYAYIKPGFGAPPVIGDSLITTEGKHRLKYISVPLILKYSTGKGKLSINPGAGVEANIVTSAKIETEVESPSSPEIIFIDKLDGAKKIYFSIVADAELRYQLNNKLSLSLRPAVRFATTPITKNNVVETFPRSINAGVGLTWKF